MIFHITSRTAWDEARKRGDYRAEGVDYQPMFGIQSRNSFNMTTSVPEDGITSPRSRMMFSCRSALSEDLAPTPARRTRHEHPPVPRWRNDA